MRISYCTVIILCLFALGLITACQPVKSITVDKIIGVWVDESGEVLMWMNEDGTFTFANVNSPDTLANFGDFQLEGTKLTLINDDESPWCAGFRASVQAEFIRGDKLKWTSIEGDCPEAVMSETYVWVRYSQ